MRTADVRVGAAAIAGARHTSACAVLSSTASIVKRSAIARDCRQERAPICELASYPDAIRASYPGAYARAQAAVGGAEPWPRA